MRNPQEEFYLSECFILSNESILKFSNGVNKQKNPQIKIVDFLIKVKKYYSLSDPPKFCEAKFGRGVEGSI